MLFNGYSLKDSEQAIHHVIQLLVETTRLEAVPVEQIMFDFPASGYVYFVSVIMEKAASMMLFIVVLYKVTSFLRRYCGRAIITLDSRQTGFRRSFIHLIG